MAASVINTPAHLDHRSKPPDGRILAVADRATQMVCQ
jgi:hypothetical protein